SSSGRTHPEDARRPSRGACSSQRDVRPTALIRTRGEKFVDPIAVSPKDCSSRAEPWYQGIMSHDETEPLPPYSYVPGGPWPHPRSSPEGHSFHSTQTAATPIVDDLWEASSVYLRGVTLFNAGYYWEAHEVWELVWHAHGRKG